MSTDQSIDPDLVEQTKRQIRGLVSEIAQLSRQDVTVREFYSEFLSRVVSALAAVGGAVWTPGEGDALDLEYQVNLRETKLADSQEDLVRHHRLLQRVASTGEGAVVAPYSGDGENTPDQASNPTACLLIIAPVKLEQETKGVVEIFQRPGSDVRTQRGYLQFLMQMCDLAADYLKTRQLRHFTDRQTLWNQLEGFARAAHASLNPRETAYTIVNEGRRLIGCDRVSVAFRRGRKCTIEAVSGQDVLDKRSNVVALLNRLTSAVVAAGEPMWYSGDTSNFAPQVEEAVQAYVDESHAKNVAVLPLLKPNVSGDEKQRGEMIGALVVEQIEDARTREGMVQRVNVVCDHSATALANSLEHDNLFLLPVWRTIGKSRWIVQARTLPKTIAVAIALVAVVAAMFLVPADFDLEAKGTLQPSIRRDVFAPMDGTIEELNVAHGSKVAQGEQVAKLDNSKLDQEIAGVEGQLQTARKELDGIGPQLTALKASGSGTDVSALEMVKRERAKLDSREAELNATIKGLEDQRDLLEKRKQDLLVAAPISGVVTTWDVEKLLLTRAVKPGDELLEVADPAGPWELELFMPEDRMGHILRAQNELGKELKVQYILASDPSVTRVGKLKEVHLSAEVRGEEGNTVLMRVAIDKKDLEDLLSQGAGVTAKVHCGRRSLGYVWLHDPLEFLQSRVLFRIW